MNTAMVLGLVLMGAYALISLLLSGLVACLWTVWLEPKPLRSRDLLALRMLPSLGAWFLTLALVLPAFLIKEPSRAAEPVGPLLIVLVACALVTLGAGCLRAWRAWRATTRLLRECGPRQPRLRVAGRDVVITDIPGILVAVVGAWRPRIVAATRVLEVCSGEELRAVIGHEAAHIVTRDNLKLLLLLASPDLLAWMPAGEELIARWRAAAEFEADAVATAQDRFQRVTLASALIKVARLSGAQRQPAGLSMPIVVDDVDGRVRRLLAPLPDAQALPSRNIAALALLVPFVCGPLYGLIQDLIEMLVALGR